MPIYEYRCTACEEEFEVIQKVNARSFRKCRECGGKLEKLISRSSFQLKGGGWFINDYAGGKKSKPDASKKEKSSSES